uniref:hypothetical protein n=1 Tax=Syntrophomonas wolfei TaxID=863 RepID=UPI000B054977
YKEKHQKNLSSIFESSNIDKVHTVTFSEAFERLNTICNHTFSDDFKEKIDLLEKYRNRLTHAEISIDDQDIILLFDNLLDELDMYLFSNIGVATACFLRRVLRIGRAGVHQRPRQHRVGSLWSQSGYERGLQGDKFKDHVVNNGVHFFRHKKHGI